MKRLAFIALLLSCAVPAAAQWSVGPQISGFGVGGSVTKMTLARFVSISGEIGFAPVGTTDVTIEGNRYTLKPTVVGGLFLVNLHPFRGAFSLGAGYLFGGYSADASTPADVGAYVLDNMTYTVTEYGTLSGQMELKGPVPAFMVGWRGSGFNFGIGAALTDPTVALEASGPMAGNAVFQAGLTQELVDLEAALEFGLLGLSGVPIVRLGWELSR